MERAKKEFKEIGNRKEQREVLLEINDALGLSKGDIRQIFAEHNNAFEVIQDQCSIAQAMFIAEEKIKDLTYLWSDKLSKTTVFELFETLLTNHKTATVLFKIKNKGWWVLTTMKTRKGVSVLEYYPRSNKALETEIYIYPASGFESSVVF